MIKKLVKIISIVCLLLLAYLGYLLTLIRGEEMAGMVDPVFHAIGFFIEAVAALSLTVFLLTFWAKKRKKRAIEYDKKTGSIQSILNNQSNETFKTLTANPPQKVLYGISCYSLYLLLDLIYGIISVQPNDISMDSWLIYSVGIVMFFGVILLCSLMRGSKLARLFFFEFQIVNLIFFFVPALFDFSINLSAAVLFPSLKQSIGLLLFYYFFISDEKVELWFIKCHLSKKLRAYQPA